MGHAAIPPIEGQLREAGSPGRTVLRDFDIAFLEDNSRSWESCALSVRRNHGYDGVWELFGYIKKNGLLRVLADQETQSLRDEILTAALPLDSRLTVLINTAHELLIDTKFIWPDLYMKVIYHMLDQEQYDRSIRWHLQLAPIFPPSTEVFGALLSGFVLDQSPEMQSNLTALYVSGTGKRLYDHIVPVLFAAGLSKLARVWRKKLLAFQDFPRTSKSKPFLRFLAEFYPTIDLTIDELEVGGLAARVNDANGSNSANTEAGSTETEFLSGQYSDSIVARWFASTWTSIEFAINLAQKLGLRAIGPRTLQSLALREFDSQTVASRIAQIEKLDITISNQVYCKALIFFARQGEDALLASLLACDVHPDEFDDIETRQLLMASSVREQDWEMEKLLQGVEWAIEHDPTARRLHTLLDCELSERRLDKARQVLERMEALKVNVSQDSALQLLEGTFRGLGKHPNGRKRQTRREGSEALLNRALDVTRRVALHDVAIPLQLWSLLFYNLGRLGRLSELEQLSLEVVQLYTPPLGGLIPIHADDLPQTKSRTDNGVDVLPCQCISPAGDESSTSRHSPDNQSLNGAMRGARQSWGEEASNINKKIGPVVSRLDVGSTRGDSKSGGGLGLGSIRRDVKEYIPADLPFSHRAHPVQRLFDTRLQRSIVRWGFDQTLETKPHSMALVGSHSTGALAFDVASGVRLLALLRDQGVLIDLKVLRTAILSRIALGQVPGRPKDRSRDSHEMSVEHMKALCDEAWGSEILPSPSEITRQIEHQKPRLWSRYPRLFRQSFDKGRKDV
ncbi:uncharacterized protein MAM_01694 [Metarhizium album ARSEF 1941]|uniref:Pentatricopeptide repeat domain-containing protein n=1 Tax=Metarhizium album (strain ARSEF 1941) TaxID=1081103 RepID=A0A0B2X6K0_METAS|nr:uncharacterized protein MAM_01694 [Metarhizium album ARSEF 1941]KHO00916.1 hypothetical protein MAM_01694 [Metarhizium album ARSEF 1941]